MNTLDAIFTRRSVRKFDGRAIDEKTLHTLLAAAMSGPCCVNARDWSFIVVTDRGTLGKMADANGRPAEPLRTAAAGILICGDTARSFPPAKDYWIIDGAIAGQNLCLAAHELGIGSVWLGTWPEMDRVANQRELFGLPETVIPHSVIALGYPTEDTAAERKDRYEEDKVHFEKW